MGRLDNRVCLITNGVEPLGRATARRFARDGATVVMTDSDADAGPRIVDELADLGGRGLFVPTEDGDKAALYRAVELARTAFGRVDALVTGSLQHTALVGLESKTDAMFDSAMKTVFYPAAWAMQAVLPVMREQGSGRIVNYCVPAGPSACLNTADFNAASTAIIGLTNTAAAEWAKHRVLCNAVALSAANALANTELDAVIARPADLENDIAPVALFLVSDDNAYVTGTTIRVDGGAELRASGRTRELADVTTQISR